MRKAKIVITKKGKKGYVYNDDSTTDTKVKVHIINEKFKPTGEKLLCKAESLKIFGYKD